MNAQDQNKKTLRHFQCRDYLWEAFEQMSAELECSTDYLINEAMRQYARSRNYSVGASSSPPGDGLAPAAAPPALAAPPVAAAGRAIPSLRPGMPARATVPAPPRRATRPQVSAQPAPVPMPRRPSSMPPPPPRPSQVRQGYPAPPPPAPLPAAATMPMQQRAPARPQLYVIFNGQKIPVTKDEWIIGRGKKSADLAIRDGNISRRHAAIIFQNGAYYVKDLGSTNGIEYQGRRVDAKRVEEGDLIRVCDYELRFTYQ